MRLGCFLNTHNPAILLVKSSQPCFLLTFPLGWPSITLNDPQLYQFPVCFNPDWPDLTSLQSLEDK